MKHLFYLLLILITSSAAAQVSVSTDYDKTVDFSKFKTYKYTDEALNLPMTSLNQERLIEALTSALAEKGFSPSEDPDLLVDVTISAEQKQTATETTNYYGTGYRYRWGGGFSTSTINVSDYTEGTIFLDLIDASNNQLVWQGRGVGTVQENSSPEKREKRINKAMTKIMKKYPPKM
jgi:hypothetical protein